MNTTLCSVILIIAACLEQSPLVNDQFQGRSANWGTKGIPHPWCATLKRKRTDEELGDELIYDRYWNGLYRLPKAVFEDLLRNVEDDLLKNFQKQVCASGAAVPPRTMLSMTMCYLGGGRMWDIVIMHHVSTSCFYNSVYDTIDAINANVAARARWDAGPCR